MGGVAAVSVATTPVHRIVIIAKLIHPDTLASAEIARVTIISITMFRVAWQDGAGLPRLLPRPAPAPPRLLPRPPHQRLAWLPVRAGVVGGGAQPGRGEALPAGAPPGVLTTTV